MSTRVTPEEIAAFADGELPAERAAAKLEADYDDARLKALVEAGGSAA